MQNICEICYYNDMTEKWSCPQCKNSHCQSCHIEILKRNHKCPFCRFVIENDDIQRILATERNDVMEDLYTILTIHDLLSELLDQYVQDRNELFRQYVQNTTL